MHTTVSVSAQAAKNGSQSPRVDGGQAELGRDLAEADGPHAPGRVALDLGHRGVDVPQRDEGQSGMRAPSESPHHSSTIQSL